MKKVQFYGASGDVTGSSYILTSENNEQLLIDLGMFQGSDEMVSHNYKSLGFKPAELSGVVLTHAHLDHCGRLPLLVFGGYFGKIYMTRATRALVEVILNDAAKVAQESVERQPLFGYEEVDKVLEMIEEVDYDIPITIGSMQITLRDAGHILGSASVEITDTSDNKTIVFSGDLGNSPEDIIRPTTYIEKADFVVMETTYGSTDHPQEDSTAILAEEIQGVEKNGGVLLIPAFSIERTQELLHRIHHLKKDKKILPTTPVFLDGPMGQRATIIFKDFRDYYNDELRAHTDDPFDFEGLVITESGRDSREIIKAMNPKVIIAGSGMMTGGRIMHHAIEYLPIPTTRVLFVGYQAEETLGRKILQGATTAVINDAHIKVRAQIREIKSLSSHADQTKLTKWLSHIKEVKKVFLIHGENAQRQAMYEKIKSEGIAKEVYLPLIGQEFDL